MVFRDRLYLGQEFFCIGQIRLVTTLQHSKFVLPGITIGRINLAMAFQLDIAKNLLDVLDVQTIAKRVGLPLETVMEPKEKTHLEKV